MYPGKSCTPCIDEMVVDGLVDLLVFVYLPGLDSEDEPILSEGKLEETPGNDI